MDTIEQGQTEQSQTEQELAQAIHQEPSLEKRMGALRENGGDHFDPVKFRYIESLFQKQEQPGYRSLTKKLQARLDQALTAYEKELNKAHTSATQLIERVALSFPTVAESAFKLFEQRDYSGLKKLEASLVSERQQHPLSEITQELLHGREEGYEYDPHTSLENLLTQLENDVQQSLPETSEETPSLVELKSGSFPELKSVKRLRRTLTKSSTENRVRQSINQGPKNPGPFNGHMLVLKTLSMMKDKSPAYLNRFIAHVDTLLWLDQAWEINASAGKKTAKGKRGAKSKQKSLKL